MTHITSKKMVRRGRIFPELTISPEKLARREAEEAIKIAQNMLNFGRRIKIF
ncbi:MAG: hypothetical protein ACKPGJ_18230 [Dolichospermum sp.]